MYTFLYLLHLLLLPIFKGDENTGNLDYFGVLIDIIELNYFGGNNVVLFKCDL